MAEPLVIIGAGGFGRETADVVEAMNDAAEKPTWELVGIADDAPSEDDLKRLSRRGITYLGSTGEVLADARRPVYVVGIGSPQTRRRMAQCFDEAGFGAATLVHPAATLGADVHLGAGTVICAGARVSTNIQVGRHVHLNPNVTVGHDTVIGDFVSLNPASSVSGDCEIGDGVLVGVGATILNRLRIGSDVIVGGAACVVNDVSPGVTVKGVPAR